MIDKSKDQKFMQMAIDLASRNAESVDGGPFGAVIVKGDDVIASAANSVTVDNDPTAHAEVNAIRKACEKLNTFDLEGCTLYSSCEPCPMCMSAVYWAHISRVVFAADRYDAAGVGFDDEFIYKELALPKDKKSIKVCNILHSEGQEPFRIWSNNDEKIDY